MSRARDLASNVTALGALDYGDTMASGRHLFSNPAGRNLRTRSGSGTSNLNMSMYGHWNRALSDAEIATFYGEMRSQYARIGATI